MISKLHKYVVLMIKKDAGLEFSPMVTTDASTACWIPAALGYRGDNICHHSPGWQVSTEPNL